MRDWVLVCYEDLSDNEKAFMRDICLLYGEWKDKYENEIKRLHKEIEWYQKQIDKMKR